MRKECCHGGVPVAIGTVPKRHTVMKDPEILKK